MKVIRIIPDISNRVLFISTYIALIIAVVFLCLPSSANAADNFSHPGDRTANYQVINAKGNNEGIIIQDRQGNYEVQSIRHKNGGYRKGWKGGRKSFQTRKYFSPRRRGWGHRNHFYNWNRHHHYHHRAWPDFSIQLHL